MYNAKKVWWFWILDVESRMSDLETISCFLFIFTLLYEHNFASCSNGLLLGIRTECGVSTASRNLFGYF